jgi:preprotein translocase subunit SecF
MTNFKLSAKRHLFIIISAVIIVIGMAVGTVCHFVAGGFFNYGSEFSSYKSVTITYLTTEHSDEQIEEICNQAFADLKPIEISYSVAGLGGEAIYKFSSNTSDTALTTATAAINDKFSDNSELSSASAHTATTYAGGSKAIIYASIVLSCVAVFEFIYLALRHGLKAGLSAFVSCLNALGLFVALVAITRVPVGIDLVPMAAAVTFFAASAACVFNNLIKTTLKNPANAKLELDKVIDKTSCECGKIGTIVLCFCVIAIAVLALFGAIAATSVVALSTYLAALLAVVACGYGSLFFTPSVYSAFKHIVFKPAKAVVKTQTEN